MSHRLNSSYANYRQDYCFKYTTVYTNFELYRPLLLAFPEILLSSFQNQESLTVSNSAICRDYWNGIRLGQQRNWPSACILILHPHEIPHHSHQSDFYPWNEFHSALLQHRFIPPLTSLSGETSWNLFTPWSIWHSLAFLALPFFSPPRPTPPFFFVWLF